MIVTELLLLITGLLLIVKGADWLVDGSSAVARRAGISEFIIGLTIVGFGTSCPELVVSLTGAFQGNSSISIGNVLGSNIFNTLMILGLTSVLMPISITKENERLDIPVNLFFTALLVCLGMSVTLFGIGDTDGISRLEGLVFLSFFAAYMFLSFKKGKNTDEQVKTEEQKDLGKSLLWIIAGLAGLVIGGRLFVNSATSMARIWGVSDKVIAITILAVGTSLPELATCVVAAAKKKGQLAFGNIIGSNIFNILLILGCSAVVRPISFAGINMVDMVALLASIALVQLFAVFGKKKQITRFEGVVLVLFEAAYMAALLIMD